MQNPLVPVGDLLTDEAGPEIFDSLKDSQGRFRTQSLFWETRHESYPAHFTTKQRAIERDGVTYVSMYEKYMAIADPTEYQVAIRLLGSWEHWQALLRAQWFLTLVTGWRVELAAQLESKRFFEGQKLAGKGSLSATKFLAERYGETNSKVKKRGRPSKEEKAAHLKLVEQEKEDLAEDAARIGVAT